MTKHPLCSPCGFRVTAATALTNHKRNADGARVAVRGCSAEQFATTSRGGVGPARTGLVGVRA